MKGILVTEGVRGDGGVLKNVRRQAVHVRLRPGRVPGAVRRQRGRGRRLVQGPGPQQAHARPAAPRRGGPGDQLRGEGRPRIAARRRLPRHRVPRCPRKRSCGGCRRCTTSSRNWPTSTSPPSRWRSARPATTSWAASRSTPTPPRPPTSPACSPRGEVAGGMHGSNRLGGNSLSDLLVFGRRSGEGAAAYVEGARRAVPDHHRRAARRVHQDRAGAVRATRATPPTTSTRNCSSA